MNAIGIYLYNSRDLYCDFVEPLQNVLAKRMRKGLPVEFEHLANCSTVKRATREARKMILKMDGYQCTMDEDREARKEFAKQLIETAKYMVEMGE